MDVKAAATGGPKKRVPREPTDAMHIAMLNAQLPATINDPPLWLAIWRAGFDAAPEVE
jgi:hypothetical protein